MNFTVETKSNGHLLWTQEQLDYIAEYYKKTYDTRQLAINFNVTQQNICYALKKQGIKVLTNKERSKIFYQRDSNYFSNITTNAKAYWLGYIYGAGYISGNQLVIRDDDIDLLENFREAIKATDYKIIDVSFTQDKTYYYHIFKIRDEILTKDILSYGFPTTISIERIPENFIFDFVRGYFDKKGCLIKIKEDQYRILINGKEAILKTLLKILKKEKLSYDRRIVLEGNNQVQDFLFNLYQKCDKKICKKENKKQYNLFIIKKLEDYFNGN